MDIVKTLTSALQEADRVRDRSVQVEIGASSIGGCRRQAWHIINQTPKTNFDTELLASTMGTAIHQIIADALKLSDPFEEYLIEQEFSNDKIKGHCDFYANGLVADWKTVTLAKLAKGGLPTKQQKIQVNIYASLIAETRPVNRVALVFIPRDGKMKDIVAWEDDYSPELAEEGFAWLKEIQEMTTPPLPERSAAFFCRDYCQFFDATGETGCQGK